MGEAELRGTFDKDRNEVPDGAIVEQSMFFNHDLLNHGTLLAREALGQTINDSHEGPCFGFFGHCQSVDPTRPRVNGRVMVSRCLLLAQAPLGIRVVIAQVRVRRRRPGRGLWAWP